MFAACGAVGIVVSLGEDGLASEPGGADVAAEGFAEVGGDLVAVVEHVGGEGEGGVGIEGYEVGVLAGFDGADCGWRGRRGVRARRRSSERVARG